MKLSRIFLYFKKNNVSLKRQGFNYLKIQSALDETENIRVSFHGIRLFYIKCNPLTVSKIKPLKRGSEQNMGKLPLIQR